MDVNAAIDQALALHQAGDLARAEAAYRKILVQAPALADIHYLLGMACLGQGNATAAEKALWAAVRFKPGNGNWWLNFGIALRQGGNTVDALGAIDRAIDLAGGDATAKADAMAERGAVLAARNDDAAAESALRATLALVPHHAAARSNLSALLFNRHAGGTALSSPLAIAELTEAASLAPDRPFVWRRLGLALLKAERPQEALSAFDTAIALSGPDIDLLLGQSDALSVLGRHEEALGVAEQAAALMPGHSTGPLVAMAVAQHGLGLLEAAATCLRTVLAHEPSHVPSLLNLGNVLGDLGDDDGAEACFTKALERAPDMAVIHWQRAQARLRAGDFVNGWREYEWRWAMPGFGIPASLRDLPVWDGANSAPDGRLLIHAEQGHGDSLQFIRYIPLLVQRGFIVHVQVQPALVRLFRESLPGGVGVGVLGETPPLGFSCRCPLLGLPLRLHTHNIESIPAEVPYLAVPQDRAAFWRDRLRVLPGLKVGVVWAGDSRAGDPRAAAIDRRRSLALADLAAVMNVAGISWVSLQKGPKANQAKTFGIPITDWTDELTDFADTAALVAGLDLVIGVDTAVIHLAGALGRPVWVLSRFDGCWRWLRARDDSPWYPGLRLYRQQKWGDWSTIVDKMVNDARGLLVSNAAEVDRGSI